MIYELSKREKASGENYADRIKSLKETHPEVEGTFFDTLLTIQEVTSSKVHEDAYDGWKTQHLRLILATLREILHELYVEPELRKDRRTSILAMKGEVIPEKASSKGEEITKEE